MIDDDENILREPVSPLIDGRVFQFTVTDRPPSHPFARIDATTDCVVIEETDEEVLREHCRNPDATVRGLARLCLEILLLRRRVAELESAARL